MKNQLIESILNIEWDMFISVKNLGGPAECQKNKEEFFFNRRVQFSFWHEDILKSYFLDLTDAKEKNRNLLFEKYAYMMQYVTPEEYRLLEDSLPTISEDKKILINKIAHIHLQWAKEKELLYPKLSARGRSILSSDDRVNRISYETYLKCEICTYSQNTLELYFLFIEDLFISGINMDILILGKIILHYGYSSLKLAEDSL